MLITQSPDKLEMLVGGAQYDVCAYSGIRQPQRSRSPLRFIHSTALPGGGCVNLFKVLQTNICVNDCGYCVNQIGRDCPRSFFQPEELARIFMDMKNKRLVQGLFLTSAIAGNASRTMQSMIDTVHILRQRYEYKGYIHLKLLPGASFDCVEEACKIASRVSVNMEAPTPQHLAKLSSKKDMHNGIMQLMRWVKQLTVKDTSLAPSGQTTQFVVGAAGESDSDILHTTDSLYQEMGLRRVYYSAFSPVSNSRLEDVCPTPPMREHRLYQTDWLLRVYGFSLNEVELALVKGNLALSKDPKLVIAQKQPWLFPVDVNKASYGELLRVPGIGPTSAQRIVDARADGSAIGSLEQLQKMRVVVKRTAHYVRFNGMMDWEKQLSFIPMIEGEALVPCNNKLTLV